MKITTRRVGGDIVEFKIVDGNVTIDLGFLSAAESAELAGDLRNAADDLIPQPRANDDLIDALDEALDVIADLNGKDNSCNPSFDVSDLAAVLARARAAA